MANKVKLSVLVSAIIVAFSSSANADKVFKCSSEKITKGDSTYSVLKKCGEPAYKETVSSEGCDKIEKWHYDCYGRGYVEELTFIKGILAEQNRGEASKGTQSCNQ